jgi:hypothetical protein
MITSVKFNLSVKAWLLWSLGHGLDYRRVSVQFLAGARTSTILQLGSGPLSPVMYFVPMALSLGLKRLKHEDNHTPTAKVKNLRTYTSIPAYIVSQFPFKHRNNITFSQ